MIWQDILKIDMDEARRLGEKYAPQDMEGKRQKRLNNPKYLEVKELLNKVPKNINMSFVKGLIKDYENSGGTLVRGRVDMQNSNLFFAKDILLTVLRSMKE